MYNAGLVCVKDSILLQFLRFFVERSYRIAAWALVGVITTYGVVACIGTGFACHPIAFFWDRSIPGGRCFHLMVFWFFNAGFCIITDIALCILPIPVLRTLHLPGKQKYSLLIIFAFGGL